MRALRFHRFGGPEVLVIEDVPTPVPADGEVLIKIAAAAVNPADLGAREGRYQAFMPVHLPATTGYDFSGTVVAVGSGVDTGMVGEPVMGTTDPSRGGAMAEFAAVPASVVVPAPTSLSLFYAASVPSPAITAWQGAFEHGRLQASERVLVNGAGGAVGGWVVQFAADAGATVVATSGPGSRDRLARWGAAHLIGRITEARPLDVPLADLIVNLAPTPIGALMPMLAPGGRIVSATTGAGTDDHRGVRVHHFRTHPDQPALAAIRDRIDEGRLQTWVADRITLEDVPRVHATGTRGRTIAVIDPSGGGR